jgi:hypothetical protein
MPDQDPLSAWYIRIKLHLGLTTRLDRAREHLATLKERIVTVWHSDRLDSILDNSEVDAQPLALYVTQDVLDPMISVLIGETVQNLRSTLDYLVYALAWIDSHMFQRNTQFPVYRSKDQFNKKALAKLTGLSEKHRARIKELQPFNGCDWAATLASLSNFDKHRELLRLSGRHKVTINTDQLFADSESSSLADWGRGVNVDFSIMGPVTFGDGKPVISTLEMLLSQVANLVAEFESLF